MLPGSAPSHWSAGDLTEGLNSRKRKAQIMLPVSHRKWYHHVHTSWIILWYVVKDSMVESCFTIEFWPNDQSATQKSQVLWSYFLNDAGNMAWAFLFHVGSPQPLFISKIYLTSLRKIILGSILQYPTGPMFFISVANIVLL